MRLIPPAGINLFQLIYVLIRDYRERTGLEPLNLSLGNPDGVPPAAIRELKAKYARDPAYDFHTYAEDKNLNRFAESMVALHGGVEVEKYPGLRVLPIAGIKTATALVPLACGLHLPDEAKRRSFRVASEISTVAASRRVSRLGSSRSTERMRAASAWRSSSIIGVAAAARNAWRSSASASAGTASTA